MTIDILCYVGGTFIGQLLALAYFLVWQPWRERRTDRKWQARYEARCAAYGYDCRPVRMVKVRK